MSDKISVLFVCVENSNRSQMAQAFATIHGGDRVVAHSAGSRPSGKVNPKAVAAMAELGYDLSTHASKGLEPFNGQSIDAAVTMGCGDACPYIPGRRYLDWDLPDPAGRPLDEVRAIRDDIADRVQDLVRQLDRTDRGAP